MWNDTDTPLAYFISFRSYGTWLHGDKRGSIDRFNNRYRSPYIPTNKNWQNDNQQRLKAKPLILKARHRKSIEVAIRETCNIRKWVFARTQRADEPRSYGRLGKSEESRIGTQRFEGERDQADEARWRLASLVQSLGRQRKQATPTLIQAGDLKLTPRSSNRPGSETLTYITQEVPT